ncbi:MAG: ABC transporter permease [Candidatus Jacksonbacteria bacterium]
MTIKYTLKTSLTGLKTNKSRTLLTLLGIVIGITSIILVMSVGQGAEQAILSQFKGLGSQTISIEPGREPQGPSDFAEMYTDSLGEKELKALQNPNNVQGIANVSPLVMVSATLSYQSETFRGMVLGGSPLLAEMLDLKPQTGIFFTEDDIKQRAATAIIGSKVKEKLFGESDAVGQKIKIKNKTFRIAGVMAPKGQVMMLEVDKIALVPYSTAQHYLLGIDYYHDIMIQTESEAITARVVEDIKFTLRELHNITDPDKDDFHIVTQAVVAERVGIITGIMTVLLVSVAAISLLVGGIGIMNIMLVSVTERTREIGLRKALGAKNGDILTQFLLESMMMTAVGGTVGVLGGAFLSLITSLILDRMTSWDWGFSFPISAAILGLSVSAAIGLIFGLYPARQASKKSPIEALRYE